MSKALSQNAIGRALNLSSAAMVKLKKKGCPMDSVEAAQAWRERNIAPTMHISALRRTSQQTPINSKPSDAFTHAQSFMRMAASDLVAGKCIDTLVPYLRSALAAVPGAERDALLVSPEVMDVLVDSVANCLPCDSGDSVDGNKPMLDANAQYMGRFWYQVAAGEIVIASQGGIEFDPWGGK